MTCDQLAPTFTPASHLYPCEYPGCGRAEVAMWCAWIPFAPSRAAGSWRRSAYHLCSTHAAKWEREGVPTWALAWHGPDTGNRAPAAGYLL